MYTTESLKISSTGEVLEGGYLPAGDCLIIWDDYAKNIVVYEINYSELNLMEDDYVMYKYIMDINGNLIPKFSIQFPIDFNILLLKGDIILEHIPSNFSE